ncbi:MAG TPA: cbb3-type cytochrome c oxidase subunit I, partial [Actinomycetota bacterium]|nr:cbb3-type cytochrome c oxidase subunit I [Actinomycetota bacterium]
MAVEVRDTEHHPAHAPGPPRRGRRRLTGAGWLRALWAMALAFGFGTLLVIGARAAMGFDPLWELPVLIVAWTIVVPLGFLAGLGGFDYWAYWISGRPSRPEDHSGHGARTWKDYFRVNTDHKVIGIQYVVTTILFFGAAGLMAMFMRAELARPGMQYVDTNTFNGLFSVHASLMIFLFIIPAFAGLGNYVIPLMIGAPDMAFPRLNALSFWLLPIAGLIMMSSYLVPEGGAFAAGWTNYVPLAVQQPDGNLMFQMGVQWAGASSIMTALNFLVTIITMRAPGMSFW